METEISMDTIEDLPDELLKTDPDESVALRLNSSNLEFDLQQSQQTAEDEASDVGNTYQIVAQQFVSTGQVQLTLSDGVSIIQTTVPADQLQGLETGEQGIMLQTTVGENNYIPSDVPTPLPGEVNHSVLTTPADNQHIDQSQDFLQSRIDSSQSEKLLQVINQPMTAVQNVPKVHNSDPNAVADTSVFLKSAAGQFFITAEDTVSDVENVTDRVDTDAADKLLFDHDDNTTHVINNEVSNEVLETPVVPKALIKVEKRPDLTKPIEVTDHMEVVVNGKKCLLKVNPDTGQLCAYPLIIPGKRRGRPKKSEVASREPVDILPETEEPKTGPDDIEDESTTPAPLGTEVPDHPSSAAEGLLELSNTGPDGVRRSTRNRGKPRTLQEYEVQEISSDDDGADAGDDEVLPSGAVRHIKVMKDYTPPTPIQTPGVPKRGRGRPRRYPRAEDTGTTNQIPAMIIPSGDGQTIMMAPIQGLTNLEAFQEQVKNMPIFQQSGSDDDGLQYLNISSLIDGSDGNAVSLQLGPTGVLDDTEAGDDVTSVINNHTSPMDETKPTAGGDIVVKEEKHMNEEKDKMMEEKTGDKKSVNETEGETQPTIIQIPENLLPMFTQKKDPVKIGLKASDGFLEKLRCQSCDFQAYYEQQYQEHILTHEDVMKCKCCQFVSFQQSDLIEHFKKKHPRCICAYCDHMAEHAYIIKRHTMRHTQIGCKCEVCGKVYKDQYVLKMHVKMVHLPADVLFECNVCGKKFTRKAHLKRHIRIHDPEKPFKCPQCDYRGCEKSDIVKHLLVHEDPKHKCTICNKTFRHIKNRELHMKRHNGQRDYKCGVCDFYGYTFTDIRKHIERKHTDCRPLICDKCGMVFASEKLYTEHKGQGCDVFMIEQALSIATSDGGTTQATVQFPGTFTLSGNQQLQVGNQNLTIDKDGQIVVHSVGLQGESIALTDEQLQAVAQGNMADADLQSLVTQAQLSESVLQSNDNQSDHLIDTVQSDENVTAMHSISDTGTGSERTVIGEMYDVQTEVQPSVLLFKDADHVTLTEDDDEDETTMDEDDIREEAMEGIVSDSDDKTGVNNDQILAMVNLPDV